MAETTEKVSQGYDDMPGLDKVALLLNILGTQVTAQIFKKMKDNDIKRIVASMGSLQKAPINVVRQVLEDFYAQISEEEEIIFGQGSGRDFILATLGEERARTVLGQLSVIEGSRTLEALELVDARTLSNFLINEHPQTIALILAHLDSNKKTDVLKRLPEAIQTEVVLRIANLDFISPTLIAQVDEVLKQELATLGSIDTQQLGGVQPIADMLNVMDKTTEQNIMARVEEKDPQLAEEIRKLMFVFEDIVYIDDRGMQQLLKEVPNDKLVVALKTAPDEIKDKIFRNMSKRAGQLLKDDLEAMGPVRLSDVETAQQEIVNVAKRLEAEGKIMISRGGEADALV
ncbi:MAG TPA: flagellar motor switch protein FliG [Oligoflexia bacterium]|nr:flagellar motor switch protein FliG [Oligoflexia bacterium]